MKIEGKLVDVWSRSIYGAKLIIENGKIRSIEKLSDAPDMYIIPGFVDAHVHIESSMVTPANFAAVALRHGTIAVVSDPHEIANVMGEEGIDFMIKDGSKVPLKFFFGVPSCVPATKFETSGASLDADLVEKLIQRDDLYFLAEVMNYPGVINGDVEIHRKIQAAHRVGKPIDGHAPLLTGEELRKYVEVGITTDHECSTMEEAREKIRLGMKVLIRQGSAARNLDELLPLLKEHPDKIMFCTDDCHPDDLIRHHMNEFVRRAVSLNYDLFDVLRAVSVNPVLHYGLSVGLLREGDPADFLVVNNLKDFIPIKVFIDGQVVWDGKPTFDVNFSYQDVNRFHLNSFSLEDLKPNLSSCSQVKVIEVIDGQLLTRRLSVPTEEIKVEHGINKIVVLNRYKEAQPAVGYVRGFSIYEGAIATSVAHDSHNIIAVGASDEAIMKVIDSIQRMKGGMVLFDGQDLFELPLPVAGIMSSESVEKVAYKYQNLNDRAHSMGIPLRAPFMTLSFLSLLVIPELKLGDMGLFDVSKFQFTSLCD
ncbi:MAG: adenine deaminase [Bacteroidales bacterium]|nr:adenine deaminase [Bacteroidales bacterium]